MPASSPPLLALPGGKQYRVSLTADTLIGSRGCAVLLSDPSVAPQHARIRPSGGQFLIEDLGGGTRVNKTMISDPVVLQSGDVIKVGDVHMVFQTPGGSPSAARGHPAVPQKVRAKPPRGGGPTPVAPPPKAPPVATPGPLASPSVAAKTRGERTLWKGRPGFALGPLAWLSTHYKLTTERVLITSGLLAQTLEEIELMRVKDIRLETGCLQRIFSLGTITIFTADQTAPVLRLNNVPHSERVREAIRNAVRDERQRQGVQFAEFMT